MISSRKVLMKTTHVTEGVIHWFAEMRDGEDRLSAAYQAISQLPQANRDTMAFLIRHLQR